MHLAPRAVWPLAEEYRSASFNSGVLIYLWNEWSRLLLAIFALATMASEITVSKPKPKMHRISTAASGRELRPALLLFAMDSQSKAIIRS